MARNQKSLGSDGILLKSILDHVLRVGMEGTNVSIMKVLTLIVGPDEYFCGNPYDFGIPLEADGVKDNAQIFYGITSFENIFSSLLLIN